MTHLFRFSSIFCASLLLLLTACDSGGGMDSEPDPEPGPEDIEATIKGTLSNTSTGEPIEGAEVAVIRTDEDEQVGDGTTGNDGSYEISFSVSEENTPDRLRVKGDADGFLAAVDTVDFSESVTSDLALEEAVQSEVSGQITNEDTGEQVNGATVIGTDQEENQLFETSTDASGQYSASLELAETPDQITVRATAEDFKGTEETVQFAEDISLDLALPPEIIAVLVDGTVTSENDGENIEDATVEGFRLDEDALLADTATAGDGSYELSFTVKAPQTPDELRIEVTEAPNHKNREKTVSFDSTLTEDFTLETAPIEISTIEELQKIGRDSDFPADWDYVQTKDIDASETVNWNEGAGFNPIGDDVISFSGTYNGNGFAIKKLTIERPDEEYVGLFGQVRGSVQLQNIVLSNAKITGKNYVGELAGFNGGTIQDSEVDGDIDSERSVGGVVGWNSGGLVQNVNATGNVEGGEPGTFTNVGGLVGTNDGTIKSSESAGDVVGVGNNIGGLVGLNREATIEGSEATGNVEGSGRNVGGLVGENEEATIEASKAIGDVTADARWVGGLVGVNDGTIRSSEAAGKVVGTGNRVGGLIGSNGSIGDSGIVRSSFAIGAVSGEADQVGGLVGKNYDEVHSSFATGNVSGDGESVGGLVGANVSESIITTSYATGEVSGKRNVGSLLGSNENNSEVDESYAVGPVSGTEDVGGLIGVNGANVSASFWDTEATGQDNGVGRGDTAGITGLTTDEMQGQNAQENMDSFDFEDTWEVVTGNYPALSWEEL